MSIDKNGLKSIVLASFVTVIAVEVVLLAGYLLHYLNQIEYMQTASGSLVVLFFLMIVVYFKHNKKEQGKS